MENDDDKMIKRAKRINNIVKIGEQNRFKKGQSGNPAGKPKGARNISKVLKDILNAVFLDDNGNPEKNPFDIDGANLTVQERMHLEMMRAAYKDRDVSAYNAVMDRAFGKVTNKTELTGADGAPIPVKIVDDV